MTEAPGPDDFPLRSAATGRFRHGAPRSAAIVAGGTEVLFLRSADGRSPRCDLWHLDVESGTETLLVDHSSLHGTGENVPAAEQARRERMREGAAGIVAFSVDSAGRHLALALGGRLYLIRVSRSGADLRTEVDSPDVPGPVVDPRFAPDGASVAWHARGRLWWWRPGAEPEALTPEDDASWGLADFAAAEELGRMRGFWWSPTSDELLVCRVDETAVPRWWISDPAQPQLAPREVAYPAAGTTNAHVSLWLVAPHGAPARRLLAVGPAEDDEYLATVAWTSDGALAQTLDRPQRRSRIHVLDRDPTAAGGRTPSVVAEWTDPCWVDVIPGTPRLLPDGRLLTVRRDQDADRLRVYADEVPISPAGLQIRSVVGVAGERVVVQAASSQDSADVYELDDEALLPLADGGWFAATLDEGTAVVIGATPTQATWATTVHRRDAARGWREVGQLRSHAEEPPFVANWESWVVDGVTVSLVRPRGGTAVLPGAGRSEGAGRLPILMAPYGGPHGQRNLAAGPAYLEAQWWADQGYAVVIADGRGTPGRSPSWERAITGDLAGPVLTDQVRALDSVIERFGAEVDPDRVGIMGWSFGGYLSALAVLDRPDRFHAAVAGAPVTEWLWYDTAYTERYLGQPAAEQEAYLGSSVLARAGGLSRPLMLIHGLADDNVVAAHTFAMSSRLLAAGRPHTVLPLSQVSHMTTQPEVAANLTRLQADFLAQHLQEARPPG